jgi:hypothetical protein
MSKTDEDNNGDSGFFEKAADGVSNSMTRFTGPTHNYAKEILSPQELGMGSKGSMNQLASNISGIISYTDVLVSGKSNAQQNCNGGKCKSSCNPKTGKNCSPLGNVFYLETGGKCKPNDGTSEATRYIYVNNKPTGAIPFISDMTGKNMPGLRGLIPGAIENLGHINPLAIFGGFMQKSLPPCRKLNLPSDNGSGHYVADADIADLDPCYWDSKGKPRTDRTRDKAGRNPVAYEKDPNSTSSIKTAGCPTRSGFENLNKKIFNKKYSEIDDSLMKKLDKDPFLRAYNLGFGILMIYLIYKGLNKN